MERWRRAPALELREEQERRASSGPEKKPLRSEYTEPASDSGPERWPDKEPEKRDCSALEVKERELSNEAAGEAVIRLLLSVKKLEERGVDGLALIAAPLIEYRPEVRLFVAAGVVVVAVADCCVGW